jgi:7-cyano-7-deazaguanine synthase
VRELTSNVLVLLSGGVDSSACVSYYIAQGASVSTLFVDYGQVSAQKEYDAALKICDHYKVPLDIAKLSGCKTWSGGYVPGRNSFFLYVGIINFQHSKGIIALGIHAGTNYNDCTPDFIQVMQASFDIYSDGCIRVGAPFISFSKRDIWNYCNLEKVPIGLTYSCELGKEQPCGRCSSCKDLEAINVS